MPSFKIDVSLFLACILAAYAILGLILIIVPGSLGGPITLSLIGLIVVIVVVVLFALAIILKGLAHLFKGLRR